MAGPRSFRAPSVHSGGPICDDGRALRPRAHPEEETPMKGAQKPKKVAKKVAQKSLKERRAEKRSAAKTKGLDS